MSYRLTCIAPCNVFIGGRTIHVEAGDRFHLKESEGKAIMAGPYAARFVVVAHNDPTPVGKSLADMKAAKKTNPEIPVSPASAVVPNTVEEQLMTASPQLKEEEIHDTPGVPKVDPLAGVTEDNAADAEQFFQDLTVDEEQVAEESEADPIEWEYTAHLEDDTHWSTVKNAVLAIETEESINYDAVREYKTRYANYKAVQVECNRILEGE